MKLSIIKEFKYCRSSLYNLLLENQLDYLTKKYPEVDPQLIQQAINLDRKSAEKLVLGLKRGIISDLGADSIGAVADLNPFEKVSNKSQSELEYDYAVKTAKQINPKYWQWILRVRKTNPDAQFDPSIFDYLNGEDLKTEDILNLTLPEITQASERWHHEQFADQNANGTYKLTTDDAIFTVGSYSWVPVPLEDAKTEGAKMQNCIGRYCIPTDVKKVFSMRNAYNNPHVSISMEKQGDTWHLIEVKGKQNKPPIAKYVPYILKFCEFMFNKGVDPLTSSDFWNLQSPDLVNYVKYIKGSITSLPDRVVDAMDDGGLNSVVAKNGLNPSARDAIVKRLTPDTVYKLLKNKHPGNVSLIKSAIRLGVLNEQQTEAILIEHGVTRSVKMMVMARFKPEEFLQALKQIDIDDLSLAMNNYEDAIASYPTVDPYFGICLESYLKYLRSSRAGGYVTNVKALAEKSTTEQLYSICAANQDVGNYSSPIAYVRGVLISRSLSNGIQAIKQALQVLPAGYDFSYSDDCRLSDIIFSVNFDELPALYDSAKHIESFRKELDKLLINLGMMQKANTEQQIRNGLSGTSQDVLAATEFIMNTDDIAALRDLKRTTKSRGIKIMVDRKIARINRVSQ